MVRKGIFGLVLLGAANCLALSDSAQQETEHFALTMPDGFGRPVIARMTNGVAYAYTGSPPGVDSDSLLQIAVVSIPEWSAEARRSAVDGALDQCLAMFMTEVARQKSGFHIDPPRNGEIDSKPTRQVRWLGRYSGRQMTGILHCARQGNRFYVIHMQDTVSAATRSFPALKASVDTLRFMD